MIWLIAAGTASLVLYALALGVPHWGRELDRFGVLYALLIVAYVVAVWRVGRERSRGAGAGAGPKGNGRLLAAIWVGALCFRGLAWAAAPSLSDDLYRYLWDGRVLLSGVNPYRYPPAAQALAPLRDGLWPLINNPGLPTIYPPLLMLVFAAVAAISPTVGAWKVAVLLFDLGAGYFLMRTLERVGRRPEEVLVYLWHPLVVVEFAGSGHADAVGLCLLCAAFWAGARSRPFLCGWGLTAAGLVKFLPWCAVPLLWPRLRWKWSLLPALVAAAYLVFSGHGVNALGSLGVFAAKWRANDLLFAFLVGDEATPAELRRAKLMAAALVFLVWGAAVAWRRGPVSVYGWTAGAVLLLSPVVHPWYVIWLLPAALLASHLAWWAWSLTVFLAYLPLPHFLAGGAWEESLAVKTLEMAPVLVLLPIQLWREHARHRRERAPFGG